MKRILLFGLLPGLCASVTAYRHVKSSEQKTKKFFEEEEEKEGRQPGADKQLQGWFWSKGYPRFFLQNFHGR